MSADTPRRTVRVFPDLEALSPPPAERLAACAEEAVAARGRFMLALAGGSTPRRLYELLADSYRDRLPWNRTHLFGGDERCVPPDHADSNYRMAREALIDHVPIPPEHVHRIPAERPPPEAVRAYEETLRSFFDETTFDSALLGLGADAHTASLFPEDDPQHDPDGAWVRTVMAPERHTPRRRITLTLNALNRARRVLFLVAGPDKREALRRPLDAATPLTPAARVQPRGETIWLVDEAAYGGKG